MPLRHAPKRMRNQAGEDLAPGMSIEDGGSPGKLGFIQGTLLVAGCFCLGIGRSENVIDCVQLFSLRKAINTQKLVFKHELRT